MSKHKLSMDISEDDFHLDISGDPAKVASKLPGDITGGAALLEGFMELPCHKLMPFGNRGEEDFSPLDPETFQNLLLSIEEVGVIKPIIVRRKEEGFEILAGEHRWRASQELGKPTIPAHILKNCDDERAMIVFVMTNLARRSSTLKDLVNGWWLVHQLTRYKRKDEIETLTAEGILPNMNQTLSKKQQKRYAMLHDLHEELFQLVEQKKLDINSAAKLAGLTEKQQEDVAQFGAYLKPKEHIAPICALAKEDQWHINQVKLIIFQEELEKTKKKTFSSALTKAKPRLKQWIPEDQLDELGDILQEALELYHEKHPGKLSPPQD